MCWENIGNMSNLPTNDAEFNLQQVLLLMNHLTQWLVRSGVGYMEFSAALKPIFYQQALTELERLDQKTTVSAISLLAGLHRKDVSAYKETSAAGKPLTEATVAEPISVPARVIGLWIAEDCPPRLPFSDSEQPSFEFLVKKISSERHPRSVLNELIRLGIVDEDLGEVVLKKGSFIPDQLHQESRKLLSHNLQSHFEAGLHNLFETDQITHLEEAVRADELTAESVQLLTQYSIELWEDYSKQLMEYAVKCCAVDEGKAEAIHTFCLGIYQNDT